MLGLPPVTRNIIFANVVVFLLESTVGNNLISAFPNRFFARWAAFSAADNYFSNDSAPAADTAALIGN